MPFSLETYHEMSETLGKKDILDNPGVTIERGFAASFPKENYTQFLLSSTGDPGKESGAKSLCLFLSGDLGTISIVNIAETQIQTCTMQTEELLYDADLEGMISIRQLPAACDCEIFASGFANSLGMEEYFATTISRYGFSGTVEVEPYNETIRPVASININDNLLDESSPSYCPDRVYNLLKEIVYICTSA